MNQYILSTDALVNTTIKWYSENRHIYEDLAIKLKSILEEIIRIENINYVKIESRAKSVESFHLISGTLEILDDEFEQITKTIEDYKNNVIEKTRLKDLDISINSTSLVQYINERFKDLPLEHIHAYNNIEFTLSILKLMEINTLNQLEELIPHEFDKKFKLINWKFPLNYTSLIYNILLIHFKSNLLEKMKLLRKPTSSFYGHSLKKLYDSFNVDENELSKFNMFFDEHVI